MTAAEEAPALYLLDANVLIDAERDYYPMDQVPEFWEWIVDQGERGHVKIPAEIYDEIAAGTGGLTDWIGKAAIKSALVLDEEPDPILVQQVLSDGYASGLSEDEVQSIGGDAFLIAYALADAESRYVVTGENSKPTSQRANRKVPDVCDTLGVVWRRKYQLTADLGFSTGWKSQASR